MRTIECWLYSNTFVGSNSMRYRFIGTAESSLDCSHPITSRPCASAWCARGVRRHNMSNTSPKGATLFLLWSWIKSSPHQPVSIIVMPASQEVRQRGSASSTTSAGRGASVEEEKEKLLRQYNNDDGHFSLVRNFRLADLITVSNAVCGTLSIFFCIHYTALTANVPAAPSAEAIRTLYLAHLFPILGFGFDALDGRVARMTGGGSLLGQELDSLADLVRSLVTSLSTIYQSLSPYFRSHSALRLQHSPTRSASVFRLTFSPFSSSPAVASPVLRDSTQPSRSCPKAVPVP